MSASFDFLEAARRVRAGERVRPVACARWRPDWYMHAGSADASYFMLSKILTKEQKRTIEESTGRGPVSDRIGEMYYPTVAEVLGRWERWEGVL